MQQFLTDTNRIIPGLDAWLIKDFGKDVLGMCPKEYLDGLVETYPQRNSGDTITPYQIQWVDGSNAALNYRGNDLKRGKIWMQRGDPESEGILRYGYTGWQYRVGEATADVAMDTASLSVADRYDAWVDHEGFQKANHYIVTKYISGDHSIGFHYDKPQDIANGSLITIVKLGEQGRPFQLRWRDQTEPFFDELLQPGTALVMTLEANLKTQHSVPVVANDYLTGSIVFRSITTRVSDKELKSKIKQANYGGAKKKRKRETVELQVSEGEFFLAMDDGTQKHFQLSEMRGRA